MTSYMEYVAIPRFHRPSVFDKIRYTHIMMSDRYAYFFLVMTCKPVYNLSPEVRPSPLFKERRKE